MSSSGGAIQYVEGIISAKASLFKLSVVLAVAKDTSFTNWKLVVLEPVLER